LVPGISKLKKHFGALSIGVLFKCNDFKTVERVHILTMKSPNYKVFNKVGVNWPFHEERAGPFWGITIKLK